MLNSDSPVVFYVLLLCCVTSQVVALRGSSVVLQAKAKAAEQASNPAVEPVPDENGEPQEGLGPVENTTKPFLTGNPQIDWVHDPNLPRELNGYNLSSYPFLNKVPNDITFKCDGLHDGFYASVPHKCQLYHHCLFGTRYDFLCANFTAFDQRTFICHFVSEIDCPNSSKFFKRNDDLYKQATTTAAPTTTTSTTTTTTTPAPPRDTFRERERDRDRDYRDRDYRVGMRDRDYRDRDRDRDYRDRDRVRNRDRDYRDRDYRDRMRERERDRPRESVSNRKRKPLKRRRPVYEYYYDDVYADEEYEEDPLPPPVSKKSRKVLESVKPVVKSSEREYVTSKRKSKLDEEEPLAIAPPPKRKSKFEEEEPVRESSRKVASVRSEEYDDEYYEDEPDPRPGKPAQVGSKSQTPQVIPSSHLPVFSRPRTPPKISRPVPLNEKSKYEYVKNT